ncbi:TerB N-terminal domain-containing protein [Paenibacillus macerans]|uniref:TerB N-terminal domain-containing protein n=1 Tax=Paenibacillus macerans TaxID=44252 RepID=UPI003D31611D
MSDGTDKRDFVDVHSREHGQRTGRERRLTFAELELGMPEPKQAAEPVSRVVAPDPWERNLDWRQDFRYVSREQQFVLKAKELETASAAYAEFVPFQTYWPTYDQMQPGQLKWYLFWREEVRSGRCPDTDLSYLFVFLYELIHGIGWSVPAEGYVLMERVWRNYRERYPKLDTYVREWMYDFALVHNLEERPAWPLHKLPHNLSPALKELEWGRRFTAEPLELSWELLLLLIDYDVQKSRFYAEQGRKELRTYAPKAVALVDGYLAKAKGSRILELHMPREKREPRYLFRSAVYDHGLYGRTKTVTVLPISEYPPFRAYITQLVRLTENKLRELYGFKGKLRGIEVEPEIDRLIDRFLRKEFEQRRAEEAKARAPKVKISAAKLRKLKQESDEVRDMLLAEELTLPFAAGDAGDSELPAGLPSGTKPAGFGKEQAAGESGQAVRSSRRGKAADEPVQAELDFERGWQELEEEETPGQEETATPASVEMPFRKPDAQVEPNMPTPAPTMAAVHEEPETVQEPPSVWHGLFARLAEAHVQMLAALLGGSNAAKRQAIAEQAGSMPELLLDEINELAMELLGDLLIDGDEITEEYREELHQRLPDKR